MNSAKSNDTFPPQLPWEEFTQHQVTINELRDRRGNMELATAWGFLDANQKGDHFDPWHRGIVDPVLKSHASNLFDPLRSELARDLHVIGLWFLSPQLRLQAQADLASTRKALAVLQRGTVFFDALRQVLALLPVSVGVGLAAEPDYQAGGEPIDPLRVKQFLLHFECLIPHLAEQLRARGPGRAPEFVLIHSAGLARDAFERAGMAINAHGPTTRRPDAYLTGDGGAAFVAFFKLLDHRLSEAKLARALRRCRPRQEL